MAVHPIEERYGSKQMRAIFEEKNRFQRMLDVEAALAKALAKVGEIPRKDARKIAEKAKTRHVKVKKIRELEQRTGHETMAFVLALAKASGKSGRYVHLGATSNDILDTAMALQVRDALRMVEDELRKLLGVTLDQAEKHEKTIMVGRTHGQHAVPTTLGLKFAIWACELNRHLKRLEQLKPRMLVGKMSGAVGTGAAWGKRGLKVQELVMGELGLDGAAASSQILQRDRFAELVGFIGLLASTCAKIAREVRNLQRTEIGELAEPFAKGQIGSSTMPHKRNPIRCEKVCGLARVLRANVGTALENVVIEHERDLTNSSPERVLLPESFLLIDEILRTEREVLKGLVVRAKRMEENLKLTRELNMAEAAMIELTRRGMDRQKAHEVLRECSSRAIREQGSLASAMRKDARVKKYLKDKEITKLLDPERYLGSASRIVKQVVGDLREAHKK